VLISTALTFWGKVGVVRRSQKRGEGIKMNETRINGQQ